MNYSFMFDTDWSKVFLNQKQLRKFVEVLSPYQASEVLGKLLNHPLLDKESFDIVFDKIQEAKLFDPEQLLQEKDGFDDLSKLGLAAQITFTVLINPHCPESLIESHVTKSVPLMSAFLAQSRHERLTHFHEVFQTHCNNDEGRVLALYFLENPKCPKEFVEQCFFCGDLFFSKSLAHPNCPEEVFYKAFERIKQNPSLFYNFSKFLLRNKSLPSDIVDYIAVKGWKILEGNPLLHPNISESTLLPIVKNIKYQLDEMEKGGNKNDLYGDGGERFALTRILSNVLDVKELPESFLDECFDRFPLEVIRNPNFKNWDRVEKFLDDLDGNERIKARSAILQRHDVPRKIFREFEVIDLNIPSYIAKHPNCSHEFIEIMIRVFKKQVGEDDRRLKDFLRNYSLNPTLSTKEMLKFFLEYDNPFLLFENPAFGRLPDPIKDMMIDRVVSPIKEREEVLVDFLM